MNVPLASFLAPFPSFLLKKMLKSVKYLVKKAKGVGNDDEKKSISTYDGWDDGIWRYNASICRSRH